MAGTSNIRNVFWCSNLQEADQNVSWS